MGDEIRSGRQDVPGRSVIALKPDNLGARKIMFETENVVDLRAAPAVDRLIVVADTTDVFGDALRGGG